MVFFKKKLAILGKIFIIISLFSSKYYADVLDGSGNYFLEGIKFKNNSELSDRFLKRAMSLKEDAQVTASDLEENGRKIKEVYIDEGFFGAKVDISSEITKKSKLRVTYYIEEGVRARIGKVSFSGNSIVASKKLSGVVKAKPKSVLRFGYYDQSLIEEDANRIKRHYIKKGLGSNIVIAIEKNISNNGENVDLTFRIDESGLSRTAFSSETAEQAYVIAGDVEPEAAETVLKTEVQLENTENIVASSKIDSNDNTSIQTNTEPRKPIINKSSENVEILKKELENLARALEEKREVESLLSGYLTAEKLEKKKVMEENSALKNRMSFLENELNNKSAEFNVVKEELDKGKLKLKELEYNKDQSSVKIERLNSIISGKLSDIEKLRDELGTILKDARTEISKELDKIELAEISVVKDEPVKAPASSRDAEIKPVKMESTEGKAPETGLRGKVLVVNESMNFIVINIGAGKGVYKGMQFEIHDGEKIIGKCKVIEARKNISASDIVESTKAIKKDYNVSEIIG